MTPAWPARCASTPSTTKARTTVPLTLYLGARDAVQFNSDDLETGNPDQGLDGATGAGEGRWRLELGSDLELEVLGYLRMGDGGLSSMHDLVAAHRGRRAPGGVLQPGERHAPLERLAPRQPRERRRPRSSSRASTTPARRRAARWCSRCRRRGRAWSPRGRWSPRTRGGRTCVTSPARSATAPASGAWWCARPGHPGDEPGLQPGRAPQQRLHRAPAATVTGAGRGPPIRPADHVRPTSAEPQTQRILDAIGRLAGRTDGMESRLDNIARLSAS